MSADETMSDRKKKMLAYKQKLLNQIKTCQSKIQEIKSSKNNNIYRESSDSEDEVLTPINIGPSMNLLNQEYNQLTVCLQATQELTSLQVLESEVNVMVEAPVIEGCEVPKDGLWREVTAECRVDLVPFTILFFVHKPDKKFSCLSYYNLRVTPVKVSHEKELSKSILKSVKRPSDAIQVLKSYSTAHRSRRTTLARLSDKYGDSLFMEALSDGGFIIKCSNVLEINWSLQNSWSPIAPFHHRLKIDLEYMDEVYVKTIKQAHKQLMDPTIETKERTHLLTKIIDTCIESGLVLSSVNESDDPVTPKKNERNDPNKKTTMAPPKDIPKVLKGKENKKPDKINKDKTENNVKDRVSSVKENKDKIKPTSKPVKEAANDDTFDIVEENVANAKTSSKDKINSKTTQIIKEVQKNKDNENTEKTKVPKKISDVKKSLKNSADDRTSLKSNTGDKRSLKRPNTQPADGSPSKIQKKTSKTNQTDTKTKTNSEKKTTTDNSKERNSKTDVEKEKVNAKSNMNSEKKAKSSLPAKIIEAKKTLSVPVKTKIKITTPKTDKNPTKKDVSKKSTAPTTIQKEKTKDAEKESKNIDSNKKSTINPQRTSKETDVNKKSTASINQNNAEDTKNKKEAAINNNEKTTKEIKAPAKIANNEKNLKPVANLNKMAATKNVKEIKIPSRIPLKTQNTSQIPVKSKLPQKADGYQKFVSTLNTRNSPRLQKDSTRKSSFLTFSK